MVARKPTFVRFVVGADGEHHRELTGVITEARFLRDEDSLTDPELERLADSYAWFNDHLPVPPFSSSSWRHDACTWFKDSATEPIERMWDLVALLRDHDVQVRMLRSSNPGRVVYEDDFQVVVEEYRKL